MAIAAFFAFALDLGLSQILIRGFSQGQIDLKSAVIGSSIIRIPVIILAVLFLQGWNMYINPSHEQYWVLFLVGIIQILMMGERIIQSWMRAHAKQNITNITVAIGSILRLCICIILIYWLHLSSVPILFAALLLIYAGSFIANLSIAYHIYNNIFFEKRSDITNIRATISNLLKPSLLFGLLGFLTVIQNRLDWVMVSGFVSKIELANYSVANKFYEIFLMFIGVSLANVYPWMCKEETSNDFKMKLNIFLSFIIFIGITISSISVLYMPDVLRLLWGIKYETAKPMIQLLMVGAAFATIAGVFYHVLVSKRFERRFFPVTLAATFFQFISNILLIPKFGGFGAAIGMLVLICVTTSGLFWIVFREQIMTFAQLKRLIIFLISMLLVVGIFFVLDLSILFGGLVLAALGIAGMYFILIETRERKWLANWVSSYFLKLRRI